MIRDLVIVGAGGFAREAAAAVDAVNAVDPCWRLRGFLDDDAGLHGSHRAGLPILGGTELVAEMPDAAVLVCVGNPRNYLARSRVVARLGLPADRYATIVHPSAQVGSGCVLGAGTVALAGVVLTADVWVGGHAAIMPQAVLTHDDVIEDFTTIASGVRLGGGAHIARGAYLGAGCLIRESVHIGAWALVGMGAVVLHDVPAGEVWAGNPASFRRPAGIPADLLGSIPDPHIRQPLIESPTGAPT